MRVGILSNEQFTNAPKNTTGSTRIRCTWPLRYWPEAEEFKIGVKYDAVIFQKAYFTDYLKVYDGIKILDLCDPDWMEGKPVVECAAMCDAVTVSSKGLYDYLSDILTVPVYLVPDTVDLAEHYQKKTHEGRARKVVWFGYHHNQQVIDQTLPALKRLGLGITVISDLPYYPYAAIEGVDKKWIDANIKNVLFDPDTINDELVAGGDFVLNNRPEVGKFVYKSDNKTLIAWALGMPVAKTVEDCERFMDEDERRKEAAFAAEEIKSWASERTVREYKDVIERAVASSRTSEKARA